MKYAAFGLLAAFLALGVYGDIPPTAKDWYTPSGGFKKLSGVGKVWYFDEYGDEQEVLVGVDEFGNVTGGLPSAPDGTALKNAYEAIKKACMNEAWNLTQDQKIETIGKNLHNLGLADGIDIVGTDPNGNGYSYTMKFTAGNGIGDSLGGGSRPELENPATSWNRADETTLHWRGDNKMELMGSSLATSSTDEWWNDHGFFVPFLKGGGVLGWKKYGGWYDGVFGTMAKDGRKMLTLAGWTGGHECQTDLNSILTEENGGNRANHYVLTRYGTGTDAVFHYVPFGDRLEIGGGAPVDGTSITTNETDGAVTQGDASLRGWANASPRDLPRKGEDGNLEWVPPAQLADGESIAWREHNGEWRYEVKGAGDYAGNHARHYFGTASDAGAALGWHELPNLTTNRVEGDGVTIASTVDGGDEGVKRFGLLGWNDKWGGDPLFVANIGGTVRYIPLPALTNIAACACSNKWATALEWIGDGTIGDDGIKFTDASLDDYLHMLGYVYSTTMSDLHFDNDGNVIQASFGAPANWADGVSVEETDGKYGVKGFAAGASCRATMSKMLSDPTGSDAQQHKLLAWYRGNSDAAPTLHYVPIGDGVRGGAEVDNVTITTNTAHGATADGVASIYGWSGAANDTYLSKGETGALEWRGIKTYNAGSGIKFDGENEDVISHNLIAGAGISITPAADGTAVTIAAATPTAATPVDPHLEEVTFLTEVWYDATAHRIMAKRKTAKVMCVGPTEDGVIVVVNCTPHSAEHNNTSTTDNE